MSNTQWKEPTDEQRCNYSLNNRGKVLCEWRQRKVFGGGCVFDDVAGCEVFWFPALLFIEQIVGMSPT